MRKSLEAACDEALHEVIKTLKPKYIIGIGVYAKDRCLKVKEKESLTSEVICLIHPSPIIPKNQDWPEKTQKFLTEHNLIKYFKNE